MGNDVLGPGNNTSQNCEWNHGAFWEMKLVLKAAGVCEGQQGVRGWSGR